MSSDEKIEHLTNQLLELSKKMTSMQVIISNLPSTVEKMARSSSQGAQFLNRWSTLLPQTQNPTPSSSTTV